MATRMRQPRPITLGADDVCFDDFLTSMSRSATTSAHSTPQRDRSALLHSAQSRVDQSLSSELDPKKEPLFSAQPAIPQLATIVSSFQDASSTITNNDAATIDSLQHRVVMQHQHLMDQLSIELAVEREARIALEERVLALEDCVRRLTETAANTQRPASMRPTAARVDDLHGTMASLRAAPSPQLTARTTGWTKFSKMVPEGLIE